MWTLSWLQIFLEFLKILNCIKNMVLISFWKTYRKITSIFEFLYIMNYDFPCAHYNGKEGAIYRQWWNMQSILTHFHEHINIDHGLWNYIALEFFHMKAIIVFCVNICRFTIYLFCGWVLSFKNHPNYVPFHSTLCFVAFIILYHLDMCALFSILLSNLFNQSPYTLFKRITLYIS
jgi:hypothetical protein